MAQGRTISASFLTALDEKILALCQEMSNIFYENISDEISKKEWFSDNFSGAPKFQKKRKNMQYF